MPSESDLYPSLWKKVATKLQSAFKKSQDQLTQLLECKLSDEKPHRALQRFAKEKAPVQAVQAVRHARHGYTLGDIQIARAAEYLNGLMA